MKQLGILTVVTVAVMLVVSEVSAAVYDGGGPFAAFANSVVGTVAMTVAVLLYARQRPIGTPVTWGEAYLGATFAFAFLYLGYGMVPDLFIKWAGYMGWDDTSLLLSNHGPGIVQTIGDFIPIDITYLVVRDLIVVHIYVAMIALNIFLWLFWQSRGTKKAEVEPASEFGRPLVKEA